LSQQDCLAYTLHGRLAVNGSRRPLCSCDRAVFGALYVVWLVEGGGDGGVLWVVGWSQKRSDRYLIRATSGRASPPCLDKHQSRQTGRCAVDESLRKAGMHCFAIDGRQQMQTLHRTFEAEAFGLRAA
jgi:hypothetical protein